MKLQGSLGWRYDRQCMFPANRAAKELRETLDSLTTSDRGARIEWSDGEAIVLSNWSVLHGRSVGPVDEKVRIVKRIYVR
jgi:alpha-ketoglutarate-dependent taurine dioxygenase